MRSDANRPRQGFIFAGVLTATAGLALAPRAAGQSAQRFLFSFDELDQAAAVRAYGINNVGQIVGYSVAEDGNRHSSHWLNNEFTDLHGSSHLNLKLIFTLGYTEAYRISNAGQVVGIGRLTIDCGEERWDISTGMLFAPAVVSDLGTPIPGDAVSNLWTFGDPCSAHNSAATAISNANHVVGWADVDGAGQVHAFVLKPVGGAWFRDANDDLVNDIMVDLGTLDNESVVSAAHGVNDAGWVTGYSYVSDANTPNGESAYHAFLVVPQGSAWFVDADFNGSNDLMIDLGTLGGNNSWGRDINNLGQIVGESTTATRNTRAFLWQNGVMTDLGTLGGANSSASAINDQGDIVGWAETASGKRRAVAWINGQIIDLNASALATQSKSVTFNEARDINDDMEIAGFGKTTGGSEHGFFLKLATTAEIAEHDALLAGQPPTPVGEDSDAGDGNVGDGRTGGSSSLTPITAQSDGDDTNGGQSGGAGGTPVVDSPIGSGFGLCAPGAGFASFATLLGLASMKRGVRRHR